MSDGANLGVSASDALGKILGGQDIPEENIKTPEEVRDRIVAQYADPQSVYPGGEYAQGGDSYGRGADYLAGAVLAYFQHNPEAREWPTDQEYEKDENGHLVYDADGHLIPVGPSLYDEVKKFAGPAGERIFNSCTGFQWGWATNCARWVLDLPPQPNPAIITLG